MFYEVILLRMCLVHTNSGTTVHLVCSHWCKDCNPSSAEVALDLSPLKPLCSYFWHKYQQLDGPAVS